MGKADYEKILTIAQCYGFIYGKFTAQNIYDFILQHNFKFKTNGIDTRAIGSYLGKSVKFCSEKKGRATYFEAVEE